MPTKIECAEESRNPVKTALGNRLAEIRARIVASGEPLLDWDDLDRVRAERIRTKEHGKKKAFHWLI